MDKAIRAGAADILVYQSPYMWTLGELADLHCHCSGDNYMILTEKRVPQMLLVRWYLNGRELHDDPPRVRLHTDTNMDSAELSRLHIAAVEPRDRGTYACALLRAAGFARRQIDWQPYGRSPDLAVRVYDAPEAVPTFDSRQLEQYALPVRLEAGERLALNCTPSGWTTIVQWALPDGRYLMSTSENHDSRYWLANRSQTVAPFYQEYTFGVRQAQVEDGGEYACVAGNGVGEARMPVRVEVLAVNRTATPTSMPTIGSDRSHTMEMPEFGLLAGSVLLLLLAVSACFVWRRRKHTQHRLVRTAEPTGLDNFHAGDMRSYDPQQPRSAQAALLPYDERYEFPLERLRISDTQLGSGEFGVVHRAVAEGIWPGVAETTVAVKSIRHTARAADIRALVAELKIMLHMGRHVNVVNLLGAVTRAVSERRLYVIVEYCALGSLGGFLQANRRHFVNEVDYVNDDIVVVRKDSDSTVDDSPNHQPADVDQPRTVIITTTDLVSWSFQVASGMSYLASRCVLHGDLAARNVLLDADRVAKICDFGLSRSLQPDADYQKLSDDKLPIKWLAIESLKYRMFSTSSDVWSFGVLMWELFGLASATPYAGIGTAEQLVALLEAGQRLPLPRLATERLYDVMRGCWMAEPAQRPPFATIVRQLGSILPAELRQQLVDLNDPYERVNVAEGRVEGDYLSALLPPDCLAPPVPPVPPATLEI